MHFATRIACASPFYLFNTFILEVKFCYIIAHAFCNSYCYLIRRSLYNVPEIKRAQRHLNLSWACRLITISVLFVCTSSGFLQALESIVKPRQMAG